MKYTTISAIMAASILVTGFGKKSPGVSATPPPAQADVAPSSSPISQPALTAWQQGDKAAAVSSFLAADWTARPLFAADSPLSLTESQFAALSAADRQAKSGVVAAQLDSFKQLAAAVRQAGSDAASKVDAAQARKILDAKKSDLLDKFISKAGKPFPAYLVMDSKGKITEIQGTMLDLMKSMWQSSINMLAVSWQGLPQESMPVIAGTFIGCFKARTDASWGTWHSASTTWMHAIVPISGLVKSAGIDHPTTMDLVGFGETGATSEIP